jgi:3-phosphoglycerate kinase
LLAILISIIGYGGKEIISNQKETVKAVNELRVVLTNHAGRIKNTEEDVKEIKSDAKELKNDVKDNTKRINVLEDRL